MDRKVLFEIIFCFYLNSMVLESPKKHSRVPVSKIIRIR